MLRIGCVILLWHSLGLPYTYVIMFARAMFVNTKFLVICEQIKNIMYITDCSDQLEAQYNALQTYWL